MPDIFFDTDFHSHLGTVRGGMSIVSGNRFHRAIHDISNTQFRSQFDHDFQHFNRLGAHAGIGIRYARPFVKYTPTWPRSFMPTDQSVRDQIAQMKLIPIPELIQGKRMIFCDDSIVRGTQLRDQVSRLTAAGAKEIHMRIACPSLLYKCRFINFSRSRSAMDLAGRRVIQELDGPGADIARYQDPDGRPYKTMVERIRFRLGLTTLAYQHLDDLKKAIDVPGVCTYCWTGQDISLDRSCAPGCVSCPKTSCAVKST